MIPQVLFDTNLFMGGVSFAGDVPSLTLPKLTVKTDSFRGGGMGGPRVRLSLPSGLRLSRYS